FRFNGPAVLIHVVGPSNEGAFWRSGNGLSKIASAGAAGFCASFLTLFFDAPLADLPARAALARVEPEFLAEGLDSWPEAGSPGNCLLPNCLLSAGRSSPASADEIIQWLP